MLRSVRLTHRGKAGAECSDIRCNCANGLVLRKKVKKSEGSITSKPLSTWKW